MKLSTCNRWILALLFLCAASPAGAVELGEAGCHVLELPAVISEPGHYCLERDWDLDLFGGGFAIEIRSDYVVVDFQGHQVRNVPGLVPGEYGWATYGVYAWERSHIAVRNGLLAGFRYGVVLSEETEKTGTSSHSHLVEGMRIHFCQRAGILMTAHSSVIRDNIIGDITGFEQPEATGIFIVRGGGNRVLDNEISRVLGGTLNRWGIRFEKGHRNLAAGNRLYATQRGILMDFQTVYRDNFVLETPVGYPAFSGGTDAGGNFWN